MDQNRLDRFFREGTEYYEVQPSQEAWKRLESKVRPGRSRVYYAVAAVITMILSVTVAVYIIKDQGIDSGQHMAISIDSPQKPLVEVIQLPELIQMRDKVEKGIIERIQPLAVETAYEVEQEKESSKVPIIVIEPIELTGKGMAQLDYQLDWTIDELSGYEKKSTIKIKYFTQVGADLEEKPSEKIGKWISKAQDVSPAQVLASIRNAKDDLLGIRTN